MERGSIGRWLLFGLAIFLFIQVGLPLITGSGEERQPLGQRDDTAPPDPRPEAQLCELHGTRFTAKASTKGGSLREVLLEDEQYKLDENDRPLNLITTDAANEARAPLRTDLVAPGADAQQVPFHDLDWKLAAHDGKSCTFTFADDVSAEGQPKAPTVRLKKTVHVTDGPFEIGMELEVENLADGPRKHRLSVEQTAWRRAEDVKGHWGRPSMWQSTVVAVTDAKVDRHDTSSFEPKDFAAPEFTADKWLRTEGTGRWAGVSSTYFTEAVAHVEGPAAPWAETQIEEVWTPGAFAKKTDAPDYGHVYRARLAYPERELAPKETARYATLSYIGPNERKALAAAGGGQHNLIDAIDLGTFAFIGRYLVDYVYFLHRLIGSWGWAIVLLTITVRVALFPMLWPQIKSSAAMRRLKPELDAIGEKYKDDMTQRGLAMQELYRKHGINPALGCLPVLLQMPVWIALYKALQSAVELYHVPFGPFIPDLTSPGKYFIIPALLGASSFMQQRMMPPQGDPQQQKMMKWLLPGVFTAMMLFLPAGLGVYMMTSTWLGITQQLLMERYLRSRGLAAATTIGVREKKTEGGGKESPPQLGKGKARAHG